MPKSFKKQQVLAAIENCFGIYNVVARRLGCDWHTAKKYIEKWSETKQAMQDAKMNMLGDCEAVLVKAVVNDHDVNVAKWLLVKKGKELGYSEGNMVTLDADRAPLRIDFGQPSAKELVSQDNFELISPEAGAAAGELDGGSDAPEDL